VVGVGSKVHNSPHGQTSIRLFAAVVISTHDNGETKLYISVLMTDLLSRVSSSDFKVFVHILVLNSFFSDCWGVKPRTQEEDSYSQSTANIKGSFWGPQYIDYDI
jgi:hypothetical protein